VVSSRPRSHFTPGRDPVPISQEPGWNPGTVWTGGNSRPHRDSIPNSSARSQSLYRLSYRAHLWNKYAPLNIMGFKIYSTGVRECSYEISAFYMPLHAVAQLVQALRYKPGGLGFDFRWCHWNYLLTYFFRPHYEPGSDSVSNINKYQEYFLGRGGVKGGRYVGL